MAKHGVPRALAIILIIAAIIYSTVADFHETALTNQNSTKKRVEKSWCWLPKYYDAFVLDSCIQKCSEKIQDNRGWLERCKEKCEILKKCIHECNQMFADEEARWSCYPGCNFKEGGGRSGR
ncbi:hypothetical protein PIB30_091871, partial [Stylosanthes scabra]|nr:hypothetical protein [Stylosanthes scabra]